MAETFGNRLRRIRTSMGLTMYEMSDRVEISENFVSAIERDIKVPKGEDIIARLAAAYQLEVPHTFGQFMVVPLRIREEMRDNDILMETLYNISNDETLSDQDKKDLYTKFAEQYKQLKEYR